MSAYFASHVTWMVLVSGSLTAIPLGTLLFGRHRRSAPGAALQDRTLPRAPASADAPSVAAFGEPVGPLDIAAEVRTVIGRLAPEFRQRNVRVLTAIEPELVAASDPAVFRQVMTELFGAALGRAPRSEVLVTASRAGGWVEVTVSDDGAVAGLHAAESALRGASQLIAMQGDALEIDTRPGEGTITTIRLFASTGSRTPDDIPVRIATRAVSAVA